MYCCQEQLLDGELFPCLCKGTKEFQQGPERRGTLIAHKVVYPEKKYGYFKNLSIVMIMVEKTRMKCKYIETWYITILTLVSTRLHIDDSTIFGQVEFSFQIKGGVAL